MPQNISGFAADFLLVSTSEYSFSLVPVKGNFVEHPPPLKKKAVDFSKPPGFYPFIPVYVFLDKFY